MCIHGRIGWGLTLFVSSVKRLNALTRTQTDQGIFVTDHLMFDEDPGSVKAGRPDPIMRYIRAWRPTFIYVSPFNYYIKKPGDKGIEKVAIGLLIGG